MKAVKVVKAVFFYSCFLFRLHVCLIHVLTHILWIKYANSLYYYLTFNLIIFSVFGWLSRFPRSLSSNRFCRCLVECDAPIEGLKDGTERKNYEQSSNLLLFLLHCYFVITTHFHLHSRVNKFLKHCFFEYLLSFY